MIQHHELWLTALLNQYLSGPANAFLNAAGHPAADPGHPWRNWMSMLILTILLMMVLAALLRPRLSVDKRSEERRVG